LIGYGLTRAKTVGFFAPQMVVGIFAHTQRYTITCTVSVNAKGDIFCKHDRGLETPQ
jgi:hypothetical protein